MFIPLKHELTMWIYYIYYIFCEIAYDFKRIYRETETQFTTPVIKAFSEFSNLQVIVLYTIINMRTKIANTPYQFYSKIK